MQGAHDEAKSAISLALVAALIVHPLDAWLTEAELTDVVTSYGVSPTVFREVAYEELERRRNGNHDRIRPGSMDLTRLMIFGDEKYPAVFSMQTVAKLGLAFTQLEKRLGKARGLSLELLLGETGGEQESVERAIGFLLTHNHVVRSDGGFVRRLDMGGNFGGNSAPHPADAKLARMTSLVRNAVAARKGEASPTSPPTQRFFLFLRRQGWEGLASWWAQTVRELEVAGEDCPTATTVLAGALLEAALVAIAEPAKLAGEWRQSWLESDPREWQLGALIKQAESARTFSPADAEHARTLANLRNRIHAGKFSTAGKPPFVPQYSNAHEAKVARLHLDLLLSRILEWGPIAVLA